MRASTFGFLLLLSCTSGALRADVLTWGGTYVANWDNFGTSPYTATNQSTHQGIQLFCLDFNDEIAPPTTWSASLIPLTAANVAGTGAYKNVAVAQYGGQYNTLLTNAFNSTPANQRAAGETTAPQVYGPPFVFTGDSSSPNAPTNASSTLKALQGAGAYAVNMSSSANDPYTRYLEAAWLFTDIEDAVLRNPQDTVTDMVAQVAAWELFVNTSNLSELTGDVDTYGKSGAVSGYPGYYSSVTTYTFQNYVTPGGPVSGISFEQAVDVALKDAQTAVQGGWSPGSSWNIVTGTPSYVIGYGQPVQEFLSFGSTPDQPPVPEPAAIFLLATAAGITLWSSRRRLRA